MSSRTPFRRIAVRCVTAIVAVAVASAMTFARAQVAAQTADPASVPRNAQQCDELWDAILYKIATTMYGDRYRQFLRETDWDTLIPQLCKDGAYQAVYDLGSYYLATGQVPTRPECEAVGSPARWYTNAADSIWRPQRKTGGQRYGTQFPITAGAPAGTPKVQSRVRDRGDVAARRGAAMRGDDD